MTIHPVNNTDSCVKFPELLKEGKRNLTLKEIDILKSNRNSSSYDDWSNILVSAAPGEFDPHLVLDTEFNGFIILGRLTHNVLKFHDLELPAGIYNSYLKNVVIGNDYVIRNVRYLCNYHIGNCIVLFNIQEMSCTCHSKFGCGVLKEGEPEENRIWIGVGNENGNRSILPFKEMIPMDAYLWSKYRDRTEIMNRFIELTEHDNSKKLDTYGIVEDNSVIKNTTLLKDVYIGNSAYIKGAFKLKNISILSCPNAETQIGEGVELVNGIVGKGSRIFYQAVAVRFVIGQNCQLKYGARLLNSVLGDNSTVSCCELLNNLIFPFHEQHHNSSFLIAATVCGQSNIAAAATIGSNHNSRSPDGEIFAGRGFWPGLSSSFKHNCCFAPFVLAAKGSYNHELNIIYPFSLISPCIANEQIQIIPGFWYLYNMYAIVRNKYKFVQRDKRIDKIQNIETNPLAPDSIQSAVTALDRLVILTENYLKKNNSSLIQSVTDEKKLYQIAKEYLKNNQQNDFTLIDDNCQKKYGGIILKPSKGYNCYCQLITYFAIKSLTDYCLKNKNERLTIDIFKKIKEIPLYTEWENAGGQIIPVNKIEELFNLIENKNISTWTEVHKFYNKCEDSYFIYKARYSVYLLELLYGHVIESFSFEIWQKIISDVVVFSMEMYTSACSSREKDYKDFYKAATYRNEAEMTAVLGSLKDNDFLHILKEDTLAFNDIVETVFSDLGI